MAKVIINLGYRSFVINADQAIKLAEMLQDAEIYETKYHASTPDRSSHNTYHIYPPSPDNNVTMQLLTTEAYKMYKLAGKPE